MITYKSIVDLKVLKALNMDREDTPDKTREEIEKNYNALKSSLSVEDMKTEYDHYKKELNEISKIYTEVSEIGQEVLKWKTAFKANSNNDDDNEDNPFWVPGEKSTISQDQLSSDNNPFLISGSNDEFEIVAKLGNLDEIDKVEIMYLSTKENLATVRKEQREQM
ncbi:8400_t:CDS:2, partial [Entrophospora sp. SA101]